MKPIEPGIYKGISNQEYHADPALGSSMMALLAKSPAHLKSYIDNPTDPTPAMILGAEYHDYALGTSKEISKKNEDIVKNMVEVLRSHPIASALLSGGEPEVSYFWKHPKLGFMCKARPDYRKDTILIDLKSTTDASPEGFSKALVNFRYIHQADHYMCGVAACGVPVEDFVIIAQEKKPPYAVAIYRLQEEDLYLGHEENKLIYQKYEECLSTNK